MMILNVGFIKEDLSFLTEAKRMNDVHVICEKKKTTTTTTNKHAVV